MFAGLTWMFWPLSAEQLLDRGVALIETGKPANIRQAEHRFIRPLLQKYPDSPFADRGQGYLDQIEMDRADRQLKVKLRLGKPLSEIERLYVRATRLEEFGDVMSSSAKYSAMVRPSCD